MNIKKYKKHRKIGAILSLIGIFSVVSPILYSRIIVNTNSCAYTHSCSPSMIPYILISLGLLLFIIGFVKIIVYQLKLYFNREEREQKKLSKNN